MNDQILIDNPCTANWDTMCKTDTGRYCAICATNVVDFTNMTLEQIDNYFKTHASKTICGRFQSDQVKVNSAWDRFLHILETKITRSRHNAVVIVLLSALVFVSGCRARRGRRTMGNVRYLNSKQDVRKDKPVMGRFL